MRDTEIVIPLVFFLVVGAIWGSYILTRHKERVSMLDKGLKPEDIKQLYQRGSLQVNPYSSLKWGIVFVAIGLAVLIGMWLRQNYYVDEGIYPALIALLGGIGLVVFYFLTRKKVVE